jgi:hypothetical protein
MFQTIRQCVTCFTKARYFLGNDDIRMCVCVLPPSLQYILNKPNDIQNHVTIQFS